MKHISYPKTLQFRNIVANVNRMITFVGLDENGDAIYNENVSKPTITFKGTVKLHGCFSKNTGVMLVNGEEKKISEITKGDVVLTYDIENNRINSGSVTNTFKFDNNKKWVELIFDDRTIKCTEDHTFFTHNRGWIMAKDLLITDKFKTL